MTHRDRSCDSQTDHVTYRDTVMKTRLQLERPMSRALNTAEKEREREREREREGGEKMTDEYSLALYTYMSF